MLVPSIRLNVVLRSRGVRRTYGVIRVRASWTSFRSSTSAFLWLSGCYAVGNTPAPRDVLCHTRQIHCRYGVDHEYISRKDHRFLLTRSAPRGHRSRGIAGGGRYRFHRRGSLSGRRLRRLPQEGPVGGCLIIGRLRCRQLHLSAVARITAAARVSAATQANGILSRSVALGLLWSVSAPRTTERAFDCETGSYLCRRHDVLLVLGRRSDDPPHRHP